MIQSPKYLCIEQKPPVYTFLVYTLLCISHIVMVSLVQIEQPKKV